MGDDAKDAPILSLKDAVGRSIKHGRLAPFCLHRRTVLDASARRVECADCKAQLDPIDVLEMLSNEECRYEQLSALNARTAAMLDEKRRFKCAHCGRFTDVTRTIRSNKQEPVT